MACLASSVAALPRDGPALGDPLVAVVFDDNAELAGRSQGVQVFPHQQVVDEAAQFKALGMDPRPQLSVPVVLPDDPQATGA